MPAIRTEITEIVTGLAMLGFGDLDRALVARPDWLHHVGPEQFDRLDEARADGGHEAEFATAWRAGYQPAMQRVRSGALPWTLIDDLHRQNLDDVLAQFGLDLPEDQRRHLNKVWHRLAPWCKPASPSPRPSESAPRRSRR